MKALDDGTVEFRLQKIPQEGMQAPEFSLKTLGGKTISSTDLRGKVVVLNFWFIGCPVCRAIKPKLNAFTTKFDANDSVVFVAVTADPPGEVQKFAKSEPLNYIQAAGAGDELKKFVFSGYPKNIRHLQNRARSFIGVRTSMPGINSSRSFAASWRK